jgi:hypothetical protein
MGFNPENKRIVDNWNEKYKKETLVRHYINGDPDNYELTETKSRAFLTYLPYPVIKISGHVKLVNLNHIKPVEVRE